MTKSLEQIRAEAIAAGIEIRGEDLRDITPEPETAEEMLARRTGKPVMSDADLTPAPESHTVVWARWNRRKAIGLGE